MITTSRKNLALGATLGTLTLVAGYVWICRGEQPAAKQFAQGEIQTTSVRGDDSIPKPGTLTSRPSSDETEKQSAKLTTRNSTRPEPLIKEVRGSAPQKTKKKTKDPAC